MKRWRKEPPMSCGWYLVRWIGHPGGRVYVTDEYGGEMRAYNGVRYCPVAEMTAPGTEWAKSSPHAGDKARLAELADSLPL